MYEILERAELAEGTVVKNVISAPLIAKQAKPGQFVILRAHEEGERIPLTMANTDPDKGTITLIYQIVGKSTALMKTLQVGDSYLDIVGPLGKPTHVDKVGKVLCVGGGTGVAVLHPITRALKAAGNDVTAIIGARNEGLLIMEEEMTAASDRLFITTDDGSKGHHGFVTDIMKRELQNNPDMVLAVCIGPVPMMKFCSLLTEEFGVHTLVSLNPIMVDGTGMCGCCRVTVDGQVKFACVDGPEFDGHKTDFDELSKRLAAYREDEARSMNIFMGKEKACSCPNEQGE